METWWSDDSPIDIYSRRGRSDPLGIDIERTPDTLAVGTEHNILCAKDESPTLGVTKANSSIASKENETLPPEW